MNDNRQVAVDIAENTARKRNAKNGTTIAEEVSVGSSILTELQTRQESADPQ